MSISQRETVKIPNLEEKLPKSRIPVTQNLDALATIVLEISTVYLGSFLGDFSPLSIFEQQTVMVPNFGDTLLRSCFAVTQNLDALATAVLEILTVYLGSFLGDFLTLSISKQQTVKVPNLEEKLLRSRLTVMQNLDALTTVVLQILTVNSGSFFGDFHL